MWNPRAFGLGALLLCGGLGAQAPRKPQALPFTPALLPGEGMAISADSVVMAFGESGREYPMGSLAKLVWLRLEGDEWSSAGVGYKCTGSNGTDTCWLKKGHGRLDLGKALAQSCNLAFLEWARLSAEEWKIYLGEGVGRLHLEEGFAPFLGNRLPPGDEIPPITLAWVGDGELLRTSPEAMLKWLTEPAQELLLAKCQRYLGVSTGKELGWWMKTGTAPVVGEPGATSAWVAGGNDKVIAVLHLPRGRGKAEGMERFRTLLGLK